VTTSIEVVVRPIEVDRRQVDRVEAVLLAAYARPWTSSIFLAMPYGAFVSSGYSFQRSRSRNGTGASFG
jgi:hypothetical protein